VSKVNIRQRDIFLGEYRALPGVAGRSIFLSCGLMKPAIRAISSREFSAGRYLFVSHTICMGWFIVAWNSDCYPGTREQPFFVFSRNGQERDFWPRGVMYVV
jgi:hypothetical protein